MSTPKFRKPKPFGSRSEMSEVSEPKKSFYIFCEGEKTENQYFNGVFNHEEATLLANEKVGGKSSKRFVEKELLSRLENGYNKKDIQFKRFLPNINLAIDQEKLFKQNVPDIFNNVGSNIGILISKMKQS